jgi:hypothetical protein
MDVDASNSSSSSSEDQEEDQSELAALLEFLPAMENYTPILPDKLLEGLLEKSGFRCEDPRVYANIQHNQSQPVIGRHNLEGSQQNQPQERAVYKSFRLFKCFHGA